MKSVSRFFLKRLGLGLTVMFSTVALAQEQNYVELLPYTRFSEEGVFQKVGLVKQGVRSTLKPLYAPLDPALSLDGLNVDALNQMVENAKFEGELTLDHKLLFDSSGLETASLPRIPGEPQGCPARYGGAIYTGTYYRDGSGANLSFPASLPAGLRPSTCVTQPDGARTCYRSVATPGHQVCDYGASPYNQFVTDHECDLLNMIPGISFYLPGDRYEHKKISAYCQKFVDGSLTLGDLPVLLSIKRRASVQLDNIAKIENGHEFTCARRKVSGAPGELYCWGKNENGELGMGTVGFASTHAHKVVFPGISNPDVVDFSVAQANVCAVLAPTTSTVGAPGSEGHLFCWGKNDVKQIQNGFTSTVGAATGVPQKIDLNYSDSLDYGSTAAGSTAGGEGYSYFSRSTPLRNIGEVIKQISIGNTLSAGTLSGFTGCFVTRSEKSYCWGHNLNGSFATGRSHSAPYLRVVIRQVFNKGHRYSNPAYVPSVIPEIPTSGGSIWAAKSIHVAGHAICIVGGETDSNLTGKVLCSGAQAGAPGILGNSRISASTTSTTRWDVAYPVFVETSAGNPLKNVKEIAVNEKLICARVDNSIGSFSDPNKWNLYCWGQIPHRGSTSRTGIINQQLALQIEVFERGSYIAADGVQSVSVGDYSLCLVRKDISGGVDHRSYCMGINRNQMWADNSMYTSGTYAGSDLVLKELDFLHKFAYGSRYDNCGLASSGMCSNRETIGVSALATGKGQPSVAHHCHVRDGNVFCTGENYAGQLGNADLSAPSVSNPLPIIPVQF
jgi:hypothetical protein